MKPTIFKYKSGLIFLIVQTIFCHSINYAQLPKGLQVGDKIPDITIQNTVGRPLKANSIMELNKPVIIDFFATICSSCIGWLPHLNELQNKYGDKLKLLVVTYESRERIIKFLKNNPIAQKIDLTFMVEDTALRQLFPYRIIPHEVWIGQDRKVKAISGPYYLTTKNLDDFIADRPLDLPIKDDYLEFDKFKPLDNYAFKNRFFLKSCLIGFIDNASDYYHNSILTNDGLIKKEFYINFNPMTLISAIFSQKYHRNRIKYEIKDSSKWIDPYPNDVTWTVRNTYSYSLSMPVDTPDSIRIQKTISDIGLRLGVDIKMLKRATPCYELVETGKTSTSPDSKGGKPRLKLLPKPGEPIVMKNKPLSLFVSILNNGDGGTGNPIVVTKVPDKNIDMTLPVETLSDLEAVDKALRPYGMKLIKTHKLLDFVVITDK